MNESPKYFQLGHAVGEQAGRLGPHAVQVYVVLASYCRTADRTCFPSLKTIGEICRVSRSTVQRAIRVLMEAGIVQVERSDGRGNHYRLPRVGTGVTPDTGVLPGTGPVSDQTRDRCPTRHPKKKKELKEGKKRARHNAAAVVEIPAVLDADVFREAWGRWMLHRSEMRKPLTPSTAAAQLKKLSAIGQARAVAAIDRSIEAGWTGIFEENQNGNARKNHSPVGPGQRHPDDAARNEF